MTSLHLDFETRSAIDLRRAGVHVYAAHPTTEILCAGFAFDEEPIEVWVPERTCPPRVAEHIRSGGEVMAHNAQFERIVNNTIAVIRHGWPIISIEQCVCTMVMALAMGLPGSLEGAASALDLAVRKDAVGHRVMLRLCRPRLEPNTGALVWDDDPERHRTLREYCARDVEVERQLSRKLFRLAPTESKLWQLDQVINDRGVRVDPVVKNAIRVVAETTRRLDDRMKELTAGVVPTCGSVSKLTTWLRSTGHDPAGVSKADVGKLLSGPVDELTRSVLLTRVEAAKSSTAKLTAILHSLGSDSRMRGLLQFHGAASTGRWAGRRFQPQNLPRPRLSRWEVEQVMDLLREEQLPGIAERIEFLFGPPLQVISDCLRGLLIPDTGMDFIAADYSSIEARVLAWLADEESVLIIFRTHGRLYEHGASKVFAIPIEEVTKDQRQVGKVAELALGYQGGVRAFQVMARTYGVTVTDAQADRIKWAWRESRPKTVRYWRALEEAALRAVLDPGSLQQAGSGARAVRFKRHEEHLWCRLPSGRALCYPFARVERLEVPWGTKDGVTYMGLNSISRRWERQAYYGGLGAENVTQAVSRDLLAGALQDLEARGYRPVMHVHDEVVCEVPSGFGSVEEMESILAQGPSWAAGLPLSAAGWRGRRYRK